MARTLGNMPTFWGQMKEEGTEGLGKWAYCTGYIMHCQKTCQLMFCERVQRTFHLPKSMGCAGDTGIVKNLGGG